MHSLWGGTFRFFPQSRPNRPAPRDARARRRVANASRIPHRDRRVVARAPPTTSDDDRARRRAKLEKFKRRIGAALAPGDRREIDARARHGARTLERGRVDDRSRHIRRARAHADAADGRRRERDTGGADEERTVEGVDDDAGGNELAREGDGGFAAIVRGRWMRRAKELAPRSGTVR